MLADEIALVTGAGRGIGKKMAETLARDGATVIVDYNGSAAKAEETVAEIVATGGKAEVVQCDVSDFSRSGELIDYVTETYGGLGILVNNAGITRDGLLMKVSEADSDAVINTNLKETFNCMQHVARQVVKQKDGRIVNITSMVGVMGNAGQVNYATSKAGIISVIKSAAREMASRGITISAVAPGFIVTEITNVLSDAVKDAVKQQIPTRAFGETSDAAETAAFLASEEARCITDQIISVDSDMVM